MYAVDWKSSAVMITVIFAVYALALLATLLTTGRLSDTLDRRSVILAALGLQLIGMVVLLAARGLTALFVARIALLVQFAPAPMRLV